MSVKDGSTANLKSDLNLEENKVETKEVEVGQVKGNGKALDNRVSKLDESKDETDEKWLLLKDAFAERDRQVKFLQECLQEKSKEITELRRSLEEKLEKKEKNLNRKTRQIKNLKVLLLKNKFDVSNSRDELVKTQELLAQRDSHINHVELMLHDAKSGFAWKLVTFLKRLGGLFNLFGLFSLIKRKIIFVKRFGREGLKDKWELFCAKLKYKKPVSWEALKFVHYKNKRDALYDLDCLDFTVPFEPGLISIVLPVYNGENLVSEAIDSVLAQTYKNFELIVVDDGSSDGTPAIVDAYAEKDKRVKVIHQKNAKLPAALSRGFYEARGEFCTWTSDDNRLKPKFLEKMSACLKRHPQWSMIYGNVDIIGDDGDYLTNSEWYAGYQKPLGSEHVYLPQNPAELNVVPNNYVGASFMYRRYVPMLLGDYSRYRYTLEDYDYWMNVNSLFALKHTDFEDILYDYRFHGKSLTARDKELKITEDRYKTMVFDDFRRDFYLSSQVWILDDLKDLALRRKLEDRLSDTKNFVLKRGRLQSLSLPSLWCPVVYLQEVQSLTDINEEVLRTLPENAFKVLVYSGEGNLDLSESASRTWDMCIRANQASQCLSCLDNHRGWFGVKNERALLNLVDIKSRVFHLQRMETFINSEREESPKDISVVICTYRRGQKLLNLLDSLVEQSLDKQKYELVIVNNCIEDQDIEQKVGAYADKYGLDVKYVDCPITGLSYARNAALSVVKGEVILYLDDDAIADKNLLRETVKAFKRHPDAGVVGGQIKLKEWDRSYDALINGQEALWSQYLISGKGCQEINKWYEYPYGANWAIAREAILLTGGFRVSWGRVGQNHAGGEEVVMASLMESIKRKVYVNPKAVVVHDVDEDRFTEEHVQKTKESAVLNYYLLQRELYIPMEVDLDSYREICFKTKKSKGLKAYEIENKVYQRMKYDLLERYRCNKSNGSEV